MNIHFSAQPNALGFSNANTVKPVFSGFTDMASMYPELNEDKDESKYTKKELLDQMVKSKWSDFKKKLKAKFIKDD